MAKTVDAVEIKTIIVKVKETELKLSVSEARELLTALGNLLGREVVKETRVVHEKDYVPVPHPYPYPKSPWYPKPHWPWRDEIWLSHSKHIKAELLPNKTALLSLNR